MQLPSFFYYATAIFMMDRQKRRRTSTTVSSSNPKRPGNNLKRISDTTDTRTSKYQRREHDTNAIPNHSQPINFNYVLEGLKALAGAPKEVVGILENLGKSVSNNTNEPTPLTQENPFLSLFFPTTTC